jgi:hypothetical protein
MSTLPLTTFVMGAATALSVACGDVAPPRAAGERTLQVAYSNNVGGDIEPCG